MNTHMEKFTTIMSKFIGADEDHGDASKSNNNKKEITKEIKEPKEVGPKRAMSSFFHYINAVRDIRKKENPEMKLTEISKMIGQEWQKMSDEDKAPYSVLADKDK